MLTQWLELQLFRLLVRLDAGPPDQPAQSMVEYSIVAALIAIVAIAAVTALGKDIASAFQNLADQIGNLPKS